MSQGAIMAWRAAALWAMALAIGGCTSAPPPDATPSSAASAPDEAAPPVKVPVKVPTKVVVKGPPLAEISTKLAAYAAKADAGDKAALRRSLAGLKHDRKVVASFYTKPRLRHYRRDGHIGTDGAKVLALLADLSRHGIDRRPYGLAGVDAATAAVRSAFEAERQAIIGLGADVDVAKVAAAAAAWLRGGPAGEIVLVKAGADKLSGAGRLALADGLPQIAKRARAVRDAIWAADVRIAAATVRYIIDFRLAKPAHPHDYISPGSLRKLADREAALLIARFAVEGQKPSEAMRAAWPKPPQYKRLLHAVDQYAALVLKGGWEKLPPLGRKKIVKGGKGPFVEALRRRLIAEGYEVSPTGERFDQPVHAAVVEFQRRHQLTEDGGVGKGTIAEFDVTAEQRLRQLKLALTRWRSAYARDAEGFYIQVNVAAQRVKVYDKSKMVREHRVIVGKDNNDIDFDKRVKGKINRTRLFKAKMKRITLAPRWYPTPRVIDLELGPALARDPDYFEKHGYVSEMQANGTEKVYQRSGKSNLLGVVKFQFPNKHAIYMHDTPSRSIFKRAHRAYSHGCVRLHHPKQMAYYLLGRDRGWSRKKIDQIIARREEKVIGMRKQFWVYIDYISATVDGNGDIRFWSDIYGYDLAYFTGQLPVQEIQEYKSASIRGL